MKPKLNGNFEKEVVRHIKGITRQEIPEDDNTVNVRNGILVFGDDGVTLQDHSPDRISFRQFNAIYNPAADDELLKETLFNWFNDNSEQIELFKQMIGYLMMNHVKYQKIFFLIGKPSTGKSTLLNLITTFCGKENVSAIQFSDMAKEHGLSPIVNKTANIFSDVKKGKVSGSDIFKMLADGSPIQINAKYRQPFTYRFMGKLIFGMNNEPDFSSDYAGIERRLVIFRFDKVFNQLVKGFDPDLLDKLVTDQALSTLLNMAIEGYQTLNQNKGFITTKESEKALVQFATANDSVLQWLLEGENGEINEDYLLRFPIKSNNTGLYPDYKSFCYGIGIEPVEQKEFTSRIKDRFHLNSKQTREKGTGNRYQIFCK